MFGDERVKFLEIVGGFGCENDFMHRFRDLSPRSACLSRSAFCRARPAIDNSLSVPSQNGTLALTLQVYTYGSRSGASAEAGRGRRTDM